MRRLRVSKFTAGGRPSLPTILQHALLAVAYGIAFHLAHQSAALWGGSYYFSLFYPAAGVRFALLWWFGARITPLLMLTEVLVQIASGEILPGHPEVINQLVAVMRPPLIYGLAIALVRWMAGRGDATLATPPMPFALATVLAPIMASLASLGSNLIAPALLYSPSVEPALTTTFAFMVGDLLGVLIIAPALLLLFNQRRLPRPAPRMALPPHSGEAAVVFICGWAFALVAMEAGPGLMLTPIVVTSAWIGLRSGRVAAWLVIVFVAAIALPVSQATDDIPTRLALHMGLAAVAITGYLAGSYAEAQRQAQRDIARRDRMLYQAERLKTLRAMSVAVIHEISQPLSTLSIESRYLAELSADPAASRDEIAGIATLVERKVSGLAEMVRRLRRFGGRAVDEPSPIAVSTLLDDMAAMLRAEAQKASVRLNIGEMPADLVIVGQEVELVQALVNLARNAVAAAPGGEVAITAAREEGHAVIRITNNVAPATEPHGGMGVGALVARAIVEAHGGRIIREDEADGHVVHHLSLPCVESSHA